MKIRWKYIFFRYILVLRRIFHREIKARLLFVKLIKLIVIIKIVSKVDIVPFKITLKI